MSLGIVKSIFIVLLVAAVVFVALVRYLERTGVFYPTRQVSATPAMFNLPYEEVSVLSDGNKLSGWFIKNPNASATILYLHGNAGNIGDRVEKLALIHSLGVNIFIIDYRGYGKSAGTPSESAIYRDAQAAYDYLLTRQDAGKIIAYGASLGGVAAIDLATHRKLAGLIVDSAFTSAADMSKRIYPFVPTIVLSLKLNSIQKVKEITIPKLFIHSREDEIVPIALGRKLFETAAGPKEFLEIKGGHNDSFVVSQDIWLAGIKRFLEKL
jgi:fermentation-respiration switch protein FrsA (DUF1100 family)